MWCEEWTFIVTINIRYCLVPWTLLVIFVICIIFIRSRSKEIATGSCLTCVNCDVMDISRYNCFFFLLVVGSSYSHVMPRGSGTGVYSNTAPPPMTYQSNIYRPLLRGQAQIPKLMSSKFLLIWLFYMLN